MITKTKKRVLCVTLARTHALENTHLFQFFQSSSTFSSFRLLLLIAADSIPVSSSIFGILMVHFSRNAYFSMQSHSLVREPFSDLHWRNKREKKTSSHKKWNWKSTKKVTTTKTAKKNTTTTTAAKAKRNVCTHYTAAMRSTEHIIHHSNRRTLLLSIL